MELGLLWKEATCQIESIFCQVFWPWGSIGSQIAEWGSPKPAFVPMVTGKWMVWNTLRSMAQWFHGWLSEWCWSYLWTLDGTHDKWTSWMSLFKPSWKKMSTSQSHSTLWIRVEWIDLMPYWNLKKASTDWSKPQCIGIITSKASYRARDSSQVRVTHTCFMEKDLSSWCTMTTVCSLHPRPRTLKTSYDFFQIYIFI